MRTLRHKFSTKVLLKCAVSKVIASKIVFRLLLALIPLALFATVASAQTTSPTDGFTPLGLSPGAPAGSYTLTNFENINLYNGNVNFAMPLAGIGGRGAAQMSTMLTIEQHWVVKTPKPVPNCELTGTCDLRYPWPGWWGGRRPGYGPGVLQGRPAPIPSGCSTALTVTRFTFTGPDGTEYELRDQLRNGQPVEYGCNSSGATRGTIFITADGTAATFVSDTAIFDTVSSIPTVIYPSGYLMLRDGTRYRIDSGLVTWMRDRNGNRLSFTYSGYKVTSITDSLNRQVTIAYSVSDVAPYGTCDQISFKGFGGGVTRIIRVSKLSLANVLRTTRPGDLTTPQTFQQLFPDLPGSPGSQYNPPMLASSVWLPDGRRYRLYYNVYGELARVELPTGGAVEYDRGNSGNPLDGIDRRIRERRVYPDGVTLEGKTTYGDGLYTTPVVVDNLDASGVLLARSKHYFYPGSYTYQGPTSYPAWQEGREYKTEVFASDGVTVLRRIENTWQQRAPVSWWTGPAQNAPANDPRVTDTTTTLEPAGANLVGKQTFSYEDSVPYNNKADVYEYDFGVGWPGALVRRTHTNYVTGASYTDAITGAHLRSLPLQSSVYDVGGVERARTTFEYDNYTPDTNHALLLPRTNISGLDSAFTTSYTTRGNPTATTRYLLVNGSVTSSISAYAQYDIAGNVIKTIDARGNATDFNFADCFGTPNGEALTNTAPSELGSLVSYALTTIVTRASQTVYAQYDYYTGRPVDGQDVNGIVSSGYSNDLLDRPTQIRRAVGTAAENQTTFSYDDIGRVITTTSDLNTNNDPGVVSKVFYDGLGRIIEKRQYEGGTNYIAVQTQYDAQGRAFKVSNPFRPWQFESAIWTTTGFDALSRVTSVTTPDSAVVTTSYSGNTVTVTDQAGKARKSVTDALGRMTSVYEDPSGSNYLTSYSYDVLDDLTSVLQGAQTRSFVYDSLKRQTSATNPESGTVNFTYDNNSNILTRTDARNITTTIVYDVLNRPTSKSYNDSPQTPTVNYYYDAQTLPSGAPSFDRGYSTGRLVAVTYGSGSSAGTYRGYDPMGRVVRQYQRTDSVNYLVEASYYASSTMQNETYPSVPGYGDRRIVSYTNDAAGRLGSLNSNATSYAPGASVSSIGYASHNALKTETYGNNLIHAVTYNNRLQPTEVKLGTSFNPTSIMSLSYNYGATNNNVNLQSIDYRLDVGGYTQTLYTQSFSYDALNRLATATETSSGFPSWSQTNGYDRYGNRWIDLGGGNQNLTFSTSTNRITTSGYSYDASGNLLTDTVHAYTFDAENKISKVDGATAYTYDGEGRRVKKLVGENTRFIYGMGGQLLMEFDGSSGSLKKEYVYGGETMATIAPNGKGSPGTQYTTPDTLGTPRVVTNSSGTVVGRHDHMPSGEELGAGVGGRTVGMGFGASDGVRQKFTQKERDTETGLDWFGPGRYYSSPQGRFTSVDPLGASAKPSNPQTWNRYSYVWNRPTIAIDPDGLSTIVVIVSPRTSRGTGNATIQVYDRNGHPRDIHGRSTNEMLGRTVGATPNRTQRAIEGVQGGGDTPFGVYRIFHDPRADANGTQGGVSGQPARQGDNRFGTGIIYLEPVSGEVVDSGRSTIYLHGGGRPLDVALNDNQPLTPTDGCVRCHNTDINALIATVNDAAQDHDPITNVFIGDNATINAQADQRDSNGNYLYPELRNAGFGSPDAQGRPPGNLPTEPSSPTPPHREDE